MPGCKAPPCEAPAASAARARRGEVGSMREEPGRSVDPVLLSAAATASAWGLLRACSWPSEASSTSFTCSSRSRNQESRNHMSCSSCKPGDRA